MQRLSKYLNGSNMRLIKLLIISLLVLGLLVTAISWSNDHDFALPENVGLRPIAFSKADLELK